MLGGLLYISSILNNGSVKLLTINITLWIPLCNIFVKKEKYHEFQSRGAVAKLFHNIIFKLKEYYILFSDQFQSVWEILCHLESL